MKNALIDRLEIEALVCCGAFALGAFVLTRGGWWTACGVLGGGVLAGVSFLSIRSAIDGVTAGPSGSPRVGRAIVKVTLRYALLGFLAYVMIARLRLPPLGLVAGVSSVPAAVAIEAARLFWKRS
ncbi:MAG: hypothetical protein ACRD1V_04050 [Vicinamibacterales bacterium]